MEKPRRKKQNKKPEKSPLIKGAISNGLIQTGPFSKARRALIEINPSGEPRKRHRDGKKGQCQEV